jgi:DivIVA domain-containing protein
MGQFLLLLAVVLTVGAIVFGITVLVTGEDQGLGAVEPDGRAVPLPANRPLVEEDVQRLRFDTAVRGYRMSQVDAALRRTAYDIGYKEELINVLEAEVVALRSGRFPDAEVLRRAREAAVAPLPPGEPDATGTVVVADAGDIEAPTGAGPVPGEPAPAPEAAAAGAPDDGSPDGAAGVGAAGGPDATDGAAAAGADPAEAGAAADAEGDAPRTDPAPADAVHAGAEADAVHAGAEADAVHAGAEADGAPVGAEAAAPDRAVASGKGRP